MRMMVKRLSVAALPTLALLGAIPAQAAENLNCVDTGYDLDQTAVINAFIRNFDVQSFTGTGPLGEAFEERLVAMVAVLNVRAEQCSTTNRWSNEAAQRATIYQMAGMMMRGMEASGLYTVTQVERLRSGLTAMDATTHTTMRETVLAALTANQVVRLQPREQRAFDALVHRMGIARGDAQRIDGLRQWLRANFMREAVTAEFPRL